MSITTITIIRAIRSPKTITLVMILETTIMAMVEIIMLAPSPEKAITLLTNGEDIEILS